MSRSLKVLGLLLPFVAAMSCGSSTYNVGSACNEVGSAECQRAVECGAASSVSQCKSDFHDACCGTSGTCGMMVTADDKARVHTCSASFQMYTCAQLNTYYGVTPECANLYYAVVPEKVAEPIAPGSAQTATGQFDPTEIGRLTGKYYEQRLSGVDPISTQE
jgi:hypothetical protein